MKQYLFEPDMQVLATETVLKQAELIAEELTKMICHSVAISFCSFGPFSFVIVRPFPFCHCEPAQAGVAISLLGFPSTRDCRVGTKTVPPRNDDWECAVGSWVPEIASSPKIRAPRNDVGKE